MVVEILKSSLAVMLTDGACEIRCRPVSPDVEPSSRHAQGIDQAGSPFSVAEHILHPAIIVLKNSSSPPRTTTSREIELPSNGMAYPPKLAAEC